MEIKRLMLENIGRFQSLHVDLAPTLTAQSNVTVLIGNNGAGKTSILKSLATSLSWFVARLRSDKGNGTPIPEEVIRNDATTAIIEILLQNQDTDYRWKLARTRLGRKGSQQSQLGDATKLADEYRGKLTAQDNSSLPLIAFYPVERVVLDIPLKIKGKHSFRQLDGYDNSLSQGVDFRRFFEWFREREDSENESVIPSDVLKQLENTLTPQVLEVLKQQQLLARDRQLTAVRAAIAHFMPGFKNLKVRRKPRLHMSIDKAGETLNVLQLSQGEKSLMALVGDLARRLAVMNPTMDNPLHGDGVVLIDEVDMHLHPQWARQIIERLTNTFPNCQFVLTTHSPLVISDCKEVLVYSLDDGALTPVPSQYGQDANTVLLEVMNTFVRNEQVTRRLSDLLDFIQERRIDAAKALLAELEIELPANNLELAKARLLLRKEELRRAQD